MWANIGGKTSQHIAVHHKSMSCSKTHSHHHKVTEKGKILLRLTLAERFSAHLLSFCGVGLGVHFEEGKLLTAVVVHPFTEVVANVKPSVERRRTNIRTNRLGLLTIPVVLSYVCD